MYSTTYTSHCREFGRLHDNVYKNLYFRKVGYIHNLILFSLVKCSNCTYLFKESKDLFLLSKFVFLHECFHETFIQS